MNYCVVRGQQLCVAMVIDLDRKSAITACGEITECHVLSLGQPTCSECQLETGAD